MTLTHQNYMAKLPQFKDGEKYVGCCFAQQKANTQIIPAEFKGAIFVCDCNMHNVNEDGRIVDLGGCLRLQRDIDNTPQPEPDRVAQLVHEYGTDVFLEKIGKDAAIAKWMLSEVKK